MGDHKFTMDKLTPRFGTHITGPYYWPGAVPSVHDVVAILQRGESIKCFGLRRIGKSSLLAEAARLLAQGDRPVIRLDLQRIATIPALLQNIIHALPHKSGVLHSMTKWFSETTTLPSQVKAALGALLAQQLASSDNEDIDRYADRLFDETGRLLAAASPNDRPILILDELPMFCENVLNAAPAERRPQAVTRLNTLLATLRNWRSIDIGVPMAIGGSVSMLWLQRQYGILIDNVNDCASIVVEPMPRAEAEAMVRAMIASVAPPQWAPDIAERLCDLVPAFYTGVLQYAFQQIRGLPALTTAELDALYPDRIADGLDENYYVQFNRRLARYAAAERRAANRLFEELLAAALTMPAALAILAPADDAWIDRELLDRLADDGFVHATRHGGVRFSSGLVRVWFAGPNA